jgi:hypothetical protein
MRNFGGGLRAAAMALVLVTGVADPVWADDFVKECKISVMDPKSADKVCGCMDGKITGADRASVIEAMKKTNAALTTGGKVDPATMTPQVMKGTETAMTVQAQCM